MGTQNGHNVPFLEAVSLKKRKRKATKRIKQIDEIFNPLTPGKGEISLPHRWAIFSKLKNEDKDLFSFRNCKK